MDNVVITSQKQQVRIITLNRPDFLNAINENLIERLVEELCAANNDDTVKVIVLNGAGKAFCSGDDIQGTLQSIEGKKDPTGMASNREQSAKNLQDVTREILYGNKFVIGAIHGWAVGAGFEWAMNCDFSIWTETARAFFPEMKWGMFPTGGITYLLPRMVGLVKARELLLFGEKQTARQLLDMGLCWKVVEDDDLMQTTLEVANTIAKLPEDSVQGLKKAINLTCFNVLENTLDMEVSQLLEAINNPRTAELLGEFKPKIQP
ncbi:MAG TPA: enoyl-CoA hydratase/isomerase family protein [Aeromonadales bacterium]|nr:enoyl-CoA hydratase/isomerase family protein [Aeromonadales bacterium]